MREKPHRGQQKDWDWDCGGAVVKVPDAMVTGVAVVAVAVAVADMFAALAILTQRGPKLCRYSSGCWRTPAALAPGRRQQRVQPSVNVVRRRKGEYGGLRVEGLDISQVRALKEWGSMGCSGSSLGNG